MQKSIPAPAPDIGPDPDDYCHDCETADALGTEPWCDDPRCRETRPGGGGEERRVGQADRERGERTCARL